VNYVRSIDGATIAVARLGSGPTLVIVPWIMATIENLVSWPALARMAEGRELILYDRRGTGMSARGTSIGDGSVLVEDLRAVVQSIDDPAYSILSLTNGSLEAVPVAVSDDRVERLMLVDPVIKGRDWLGLPHARAFRAAMMEDWVWATNALAASNSGWTRADPGVAQVFRSATTAADLEALNVANEQLDVTSLLGQVGAKVAVSYSPSWYFPVEYARELAGLVPDCELIVLPNGPGSQPHYAGALGAADTFFDRSSTDSQAPLSPFGSGSQTIMFTDLESSTSLTQRLGDERAQELLRTHDRTVREALEAHGGREVKHTGDGIMASFSSAVAAVRAGLAIQSELAGSAIRVRIGLNAGEPIAENDDYFGTAVQLAARICDRAEPGDVLVSRVVADLCGGKDLAFVHHSDAQLKGVDEPVSLYTASARTP
jgi:class 3 adenylate cyclase/pimeloyl-ACP methyl ester carboxylesterase